MKFPAFWLASLGMALMSATIPATLMAQAPSTRPPVPIARLTADATQIQMQWEGQTYIIEASELSAQVFDALDCDRFQLAEQQTVTGDRFFRRTLRVDRRTGNLAVGVLFHECIETQVSGVFVIKPHSDGYTTHLVQVPGTRPLSNDTSTYALNSITALGYLDGDLMVRHGDASGSEAVLIFAPSEIPAYAGCVYTRVDEGDRLCPAEAVAN